MQSIEKKTDSLVQDKVQPPPEPAKTVEEFVKGLSPSYIVAERSTKSQTNIADNYTGPACLLAVIRTGTSDIRHC